MNFQALSPSDPEAKHEAVGETLDCVYLRVENKSAHKQTNFVSNLVVLEELRSCTDRHDVIVSILVVLEGFLEDHDGIAQRLGHTEFQSLLFWKAFWKRIPFPCPTGIPRVSILVVLEGFLEEVPLCHTVNPLLFQSLLFWKAFWKSIRAENRAPSAVFQSLLFWKAFWKTFAISDAVFEDDVSILVVLEGFLEA